MTDNNLLVFDSVKELIEYFNQVGKDPDNDKVCYNINVQILKEGDADGKNYD